MIEPLTKQMLEDYIAYYTQLMEQNLALAETEERQDLDSSHTLHLANQQKVMVEYYKGQLERIKEQTK